MYCWLEMLRFLWVLLPDVSGRLRVLAAIVGPSGSEGSSAAVTQDGATIFDRCIGTRHRDLGGGRPMAGPIHPLCAYRARVTTCELGMDLRNPAPKTVAAVYKSFWSGGARVRTSSQVKATLKSFPEATGFPPVTEK